MTLPVTSTFTPIGHGIRLEEKELIPPWKGLKVRRFDLGDQKMSPALRNKLSVYTLSYHKLNVISENGVKELWYCRKQDAYQLKLIPTFLPFLKN